MLSVSRNGRYLEREGKDFFLLADTSWELVHRTVLEEAKEYIDTRAEQGFNSFLTVAVTEQAGAHRPSRYGEFPFSDKDVAKPNSTYFAYLRRIVEYANEKGMVPGILPSWGSAWNQGVNPYPPFLTPSNAEEYARYIAKAIGDLDLFWVLGGDRTIETLEQREIIERMASGLLSENTGSHLITFHPGGVENTCRYIKDARWLSFCMMQSSHAFKVKENWRDIEADYAAPPVKPTMEAEPCYEGHPIMTPDWKRTGLGRFSDYDIRTRAYWSVFAGGCGFAYGAHPVWQMYQPGYEPITEPEHTWQEGLSYPGAQQLVHLKVLMLKKPFSGWVPDQKALIFGPGEMERHVQCLRQVDWSCVLVYIPQPEQEVELLVPEAVGTLSFRWMNPATGEYSEEQRVRTEGSLKFISPKGWMDSVLVIESTEKEQ